MNYLKYGVGIDMALEKFDVCLSLIDDHQKVTVVSTTSFANNLKGFNLFQNWMYKRQKFSLPVIYLVEATGIYHEQLAWYLFEKNCSLVVILPNKAKKYKEALGIKSKNDKIDAIGLARLVCEQHLKLWQPVSKSIYKMRILTRQIEAISAQITVVQNQLHALSHGMFRVKEVEKMLKKQKLSMEQQKEKLERVLVQIVDGDSGLKRRFSAILKIKGLGFLSLATIIAETDGFALTENQSQITSYAGYDVVENQSGNRIGKTKISKKGNCHIRRAMYFPALNVVRYNQGNFKNLYERVYKSSGIKMKGYVAVQRKLLCLIYTLWKNDEVFENRSQKINSGNDEVGLSFALPLQKAPTKRASTKVKAPQDKLPSTSRRKLSFA